MTDWKTHLKVIGIFAGFVAAFFAAEYEALRYALLGGCAVAFYVFTYKLLKPWKKVKGTGDE